MLVPGCQSVKQMFICCRLWETAPPILSGENGPLRQRNLKQTVPGKHLWLQQLSRRCNRSHTAAKYLLWVICLLTRLVAASWGREQNAFQTADKALSVVSAFLRRAALRTATSEKTSQAVLLFSSSSTVHASNEPSVSSVKRVCVCQQVHLRRISALLDHVYGIVISPVNRKSLWGKRQIVIWCRACVLNVRVCAHARTHC